MQQPKRVLVVDDENSMVEIIRYALEDAGYSVAEAGDADEACQRMTEFHPDLMILDVMMPGRSGLEFCKELREESDIPVIMLSARAEEIDKVLGFELGADDYVTKPFSPRELISRVRAHLRRSAIDARERNGSSIVVGELCLDTDTHEAYLRGEPVHLTRSEFQILILLARHLGKTYSRSAILNCLWHGGFVGDERAIDVHVHNIREKIELIPAQPEYLLTVRGVGYRLREP